MYIYIYCISTGTGKTLSFITREIICERKKWRRRVKSAQTGESLSSGKTAPRRETCYVYNMQIDTPTLPPKMPAWIEIRLRSLSLFFFCAILYCVICVNKIYESGR